MVFMHRGKNIEGGIMKGLLEVQEVSGPLEPCVGHRHDDDDDAGAGNLILDLVTHTLVFKIISIL